MPLAIAVVVLNATYLVPDIVGRLARNSALFDFPGAPVSIHKYQIHQRTLPLQLHADTRTAYSTQRTVSLETF